MVPSRTSLFTTTHKVAQRVSLPSTSNDVATAPRPSSNIITGSLMGVSIDCSSDLFQPSSSRLVCPHTFVHMCMFACAPFATGAAAIVRFDRKCEALHVITTSRLPVPAAAIPLVQSRSLVGRLPAARMVGFSWSMRGKEGPSLIRIGRSMTVAYIQWV